MADVDLPVAAVRQQIAGALDLVAHQERDGDGARRVVAIAEVVEDPLRGVAARRLYERRHGGRPVWRASADPGRRARLEGAKPL
jgi:pilus assembly protein CpaF